MLYVLAPGDCNTPGASRQWQEIFRIAASVGGIRFHECTARICERGGRMKRRVDVNYDCSARDGQVSGDSREGESERVTGLEMRRLIWLVFDDNL